MIFIDWLTVYQVHHDKQLPVIGKDYKFSQDIETGQLNYTLVTSYAFEGSHDTSLRVRCDGSRVEVSGNPSAFSRLDNLYGFDSMSSCIDLYNSILQSVGLPPFTAGDSKIVGKTGLLRHLDSAVITRVDLTENLKTGNALLYLRAISSYSHHGQAGHLYPNGATVDWNGKNNGYSEDGSKRVYIKYYAKSFDIDKKTAKLEKSGSKLIDNHESYYFRESSTYLNRIKKFCDDENIVRLEVSFKSKQLGRLNLQHIKNWSKEVMSNIIKPYQFHNKIKVEQSNLLSNYEKLLSLGYTESEAQNADLALNAWLNGKPLHYSNYGGLKRDKFYRMRKILLSVGIDISTPCDILRMPIQTIKHEVKPVDPPAWYDMPENRPTLKLVG